MTDQYIKMCQEAKEIQALWEPINGDRYGSPRIDAQSIMDDAMLREPIDRIKNELIWLPRIEDLIKISSDGIFGCDSDDHWLDEFYGYNEVFPNANDSIIIRILKFTMLNLYSKSWNGETWI